MARAAILKKLLVAACVVAGAAVGRAEAAPAGAAASAPYSPSDVILNSTFTTKNAGKTAIVPTGIFNTLTSTSIAAKTITLNGVALTTAAAQVPSTFPQTITFQNGLLSSTATFTGLVNGTTVTLTGSITATQIHGSSMIITGTITGANVYGTNTGDVTIASANGLSITGQALSAALASSTSTGTLRAFDFNAFTAKLSPNGNGSALTGLTKTQVGLDQVQNVDQTNADNVTSGLFDPARLATGTASSQRYLRGDSFWAILNSTAVGLGQVTNDRQVRVADYTQKGAILIGISTGSFAVLSPGTDGFIFSSDSTQPTGYRWVRSPASYTVYPATSQAEFPLGFVAGLSYFTGTLIGMDVSFTTGTFSGLLGASNLSGTNTGDVTIGTSNGLALNVQQLSMALASASQNGSLSATDWTRFDAKQGTFTVSAPITSSGGVVGIDKSSATLLGPSPLTTVIGEGTNLYYTTARATSAISATSPLTYSNGVLGIPSATTTSTGALTSTNWNTFNNKASTSGATLTNTILSSATISNFILNGGTILGTIADASTTTLSGRRILSGASWTGTATDLSTTTHSGSHTFTYVALSSASVSSMTVVGNVKWPGGYATKSRPGYFNVKDFGATGNGTTDDSAAVTAAMVALGQGELYFPAGTYKMGILIGTSNISLIGDQSGTFFTAIDTSTFIVNITGTGVTTRRYIKNITFLGTSMTTRGLYVNAFGFITIQNCRFDNLEYGIYTNASEWLHYLDTWFFQNKYGLYTTTLTSDILGNSYTFGQNSAAHFMTNCEFWYNTVGFYNENGNNPINDAQPAFSIDGSEFLANTLAVATNGGLTFYYPLSLNYCWFEQNTKTGTTTIGSNTYHNGDIDFRGGSLYIRSVGFLDSFYASQSSRINGSDIRFADIPMSVSTDTVVSLENVIGDAAGGMILDWAEVRSLNFYTAGRPVLAQVPPRSAFVLNMSTRNVIFNGTASCAIGSLPPTFSGSPTKSFVFGDGFYANTAVSVQGVAGDTVGWQSATSTSKWYVTTFAIRATTPVGVSSVTMIAAGAFVAPGGVLTVTNEWRTYGVIGQPATSGTASMEFTLNSSETILFSCVQVISFDTKQQAQAFLDSDSFVLPLTEIANRQYASTTPPTTGAWNAGDLVWNTTPSSGTGVGFVCITGGTPGSWSKFGDVGYSSSTVIESVVSVSTNAPVSGHDADMTSISLPAGRWIINSVVFSLATAAVVTTWEGFISDTAGDNQTNSVFGSTRFQGLSPTATNGVPVVIPGVAVTLTTTTPYYLKYGSTYTGATPQFRGRITAYSIP